jgi:hypothetical protein
MEFIVEDGSGYSDATSYVDLEFANEYFARTGYTAWSDKTDEEKEAILEEGTEYADLRWGLLLAGTLQASTQALQFPRSKLADRYGRAVIGVPTPWKRAVCEYAMQSTKGDLIAASIETVQDLKKTKTVVGPITTEKEFFVGSTSSTFKNFPKADLLVKPYLGVIFAKGSGKTLRT